MEVLIAPVSGSYFANQLGAYKNLLAYGYEPEIYLGASGGIIGIIILSCSGNTQNGLLTTAGTLDSCYLVKDWNSVIPGILMCVFKGSLYQHSGQHQCLLKNIATPGLMKEKEIWFHCFNLGKGRTSLYCTGEEGKTRLQPIDCDIFLTDVYHADGNLEVISDAILASVAIPTMMPCIELNGQPHFDGGLTFATPFLLLRDSILSYHRKTKKPFHMVMTNPFDLENLRNVDLFNIAEKAKVSISLLVKSSILIERQNARRLLFEIRGNKEVMEIKDVSLSHYFKNKKKWKASLLECYPSEEEKINFQSFTGEDLVNKINKCAKIIKHRVWYVPS